MWELYLNGKEVDLKGTSITIKKQANDLAEVKDSQNHHTNKFKLPNTKNNAEILEFLGVVGSKSRLPYLETSANLLDNGYPVITKGKAIISKDTKGYFYCTIYDGNIFLFERLGSKRLMDLNFDDLDHELNNTTYVDSFSNTSGYIYALSDYGKIKTDIEINYQMPCFYVHTIFERIMNEAGFSYSGSIFNTEHFKRKIITPYRGYNSEIDPIDNIFSITTDAVSKHKDIGGAFYGRIEVDLQPNQTMINNNRIIIPQDGNYNFSLTGTVTSNSPHANGWTLDVRDNGDFTGPNYYDWVLAIDNAPLGSVQTVSGWGSFQAGDIVYVGVELLFDTYDHNLEENCNYCYYVEYTDMQVTFSTYNTDVLQIHVANFIGKMSQKSFVKDVMQRYGLVMQKDLFNKHYYFERIDTIFNDRGNAIDISEQFNKELSKTYQTRKYVQRNHFNYNYKDKDIEHFADGILLVENENLRTWKTHLVAPYYASELSENVYNNQLLYNTPLWEVIRDDNGVVTKYKPISSMNYIGDVVRNQETITYGITGNTIDTFNGLVPRYSFDTLDYQTVINDNYKALETSLNWYQNIKLEALVTKEFIRNFDAFKLIYVKQLSSYFYVNSIVKKTNKIAVFDVMKVQPNTSLSIVARTGIYRDTTEQKVLLDGGSSIGKTTSNWSIISKPSGSTSTLPVKTKIKEELTLDVVGSYLLKLEVSNGIETKTSKVLIKKI